MTPSKPAILIILGSAGDLTHRKLLPALYNLFLDQRLPEKLAILALDRKSMKEEQFHNSLLEGVNEFSRRGKVEEARWDHFARLIKYKALDFTEANSYSQMAEFIKTQEEIWNEPADHIFYLAVAPTFIEPILNHLAETRLLSDHGRNRIVIEKPFGRDLKSAIHLNETLSRVADESQIFRIDHFLGKETVQNILALRFANSLFEPLWNRTYIDHIQITVAEQIGIEQRGAYYDHAGALRDMLENHLFQLLGMVAMEPPTSFDQDEIRNKKVDVLHAIRSIPRDQVAEVAVRGQYSDYRHELDVHPQSGTETFAALKLFVDNWRWQGVPFYLRTGKRMAQRMAEISIQFKSVPHRSFPPSTTDTCLPNLLRIRIQPDEEITLQFQAKEPGTSFELKPVQMKFSYKDSFFKTESGSLRNSFARYF